MECYKIILTCLQSLGRDGDMSLTVAYEDSTGKKEIILRERACEGNILESQQMDELRLMLINNCTSDITYCVENGYNVLTICIKE